MAQTKAQLLGPVVGDVVMDVSTLSLDAEGNKVGIGHSEPDLTLHVSGVDGLPSTSGSTSTGHLTLRDKATSTKGMFFGVSNASPFGSWIQAQDSANNATNYPLLLNPNGGNVGVGVSDPRYTLDVHGGNLLVSGSAAGNLILEDRAVADGSRPFTVLQSDGGYFNINRSNRNASGTTTSSALALRIAPDGQVRIGTSGGDIGILNVHTETDGNLHVRDIASVTGSSPAGSGVVFDVLNDASNTIKDLGFRGATTIFRNVTGETLRITSDGKVGVGEDNVQAHFHVAKNIADSDAINWTGSQLSVATPIAGNNTANRATIYFAPYGSDNNYAPSAISASAGTSGASTLKFFTNSSGNLTGQVQNYERLRINSAGLVGISDSDPRTGLTINKYGTAPTTNNHTYSMPAGRWVSTWSTGTSNSVDYWAGFGGSGYGISSATVNIALSPNHNDTSQQAGMYIAGEATSATSSDFTIGKIVAGSATGSSDVAGNQRATKSELMRIDSAGNTTLGYAGSSLHFQNGFNNSTARIQNGGGSNNSELKFLVKNAGTESEKMRLTSTAGLAIVTAGSMSANAGNETLYVMGEGHNGHGTGNTRSVVSIIGALTSNPSGIGIWMGARTNENTAVIGTRTANGNLAFETYSGGWGERMRLLNTGQLVIGGTANLAHPNMDDLIIGDANGNRGLTVCSGTSGFGSVCFGDSADGSGNDRYEGFVEYWHGDDTLRLGTAHTEKFRIDANGFVGINQISPQTELNVKGTISTGRNLAREVGTVIASSTNFNSSRDAENVINGVKNYEGHADWLTAGNNRNNANLTIDLGASYYVDRIVIYNQNEYDNSRREVKQFHLEGSNDNSTWTLVLDDELGKSNGHEPNPGWSFRLPANYADGIEGLNYRYWKFHMKTFHGSDPYGGIMEIELYEASDDVISETTTHSLVAGDVYTETASVKRLTVGPGAGGQYNTHSEVAFIKGAIASGQNTGNGSGNSTYHTGFRCYGYNPEGINNRFMYTVDGYTARKTFSHYFPNGQSNRALRLHYGSSSWWTCGFITIHSTYSNQNASGMLRYEFIHNANGTTSYGKTVDANVNRGSTSGNFGMSNSYSFKSWGSNGGTGDTHALEIRHLTSTGNGCYVVVELYGLYAESYISNLYMTTGHTY